MKKERHVVKKLLAFSMAAILPVASGMTVRAEESDDSSSDSGKEETVYVIADANGNPTRTIVSAWLKNQEEADTITDRSTLTGIENVKGSETYTTDANGDLVWQADGSDIYYQGSSDAPLPITANITYTLDGVDVTPELLEGATGHLVMTFHYINHTAAERVVNGKSVTLYQPFAVVSGAMLDNSKVSNVEVTNGKVINSGDQTIVVGLAMPGLKESLGLDELEDSDGNPVDIDVPESVTIEADVTDFSLLTTITIAENTLLDELDLEDVKTFDDLQEAMDELQGVTLESIVIATRTARAVRRLAERGVVSLNDYPLLMHVDAIINEGAEVNIPWEQFTMKVEG